MAVDKSTRLPKSQIPPTNRTPYSRKGVRSGNAYGNRPGLVKSGKKK